MKMNNVASIIKAIKKRLPKGMNPYTGKQGPPKRERKKE